MKIFRLLRSGCAASALMAGLTALAPLSSGAATPSAPPKSDAGAGANADKAWLDLVAATRPPQPPAEWQNRQPTEEELNAFRKKNSVLAGDAADKAKKFYTQFPDHPQAKEARDKERELLEAAVMLGSTNRLAQLEKIEQEQLKDPKLSEDDRFGLRAHALERSAMMHQSEGMPAVVAAFEKGVRELQKEFPKRPEIYQMLLEIVKNAPPEKGKSIVDEIQKSDAPAEIKEAAMAVMKKMNLVGQTLPIHFTSVDGRQVDLEKMKGKVVLVDFWATWCGPCVEELPHVKAAYDKLHPKGFEIVGISFDQRKEQLVEFTAKKDMSWPQYFDGAGWGNKIGREYGIDSIPAMWLIDKKGKVRDLNARDDLASKVEKLLAEKE